MFFKGDKVELAYPDKVIDYCTNKMNGKKDEDKSPFLISFLVDYNMVKAKQMKKDLADQSQDDVKLSLKTLVVSSIEMLDSLAKIYDTIRHNYWNYLISKWKQEFAHYL